MISEGKKAKKYKGERNWPAVIVAAVILAAGIMWTELEIKAAEESRYIASWSITVNQNIEWTWAGKGQ